MSIGFPHVWLEPARNNPTPSTRLCLKRGLTLWRQVAFALFFVLPERVRPLFKQSLVGGQPKIFTHIERLKPRATIFRVNSQDNG